MYSSLRRSAAWPAVAGFVLVAGLGLVGARAARAQERPFPIEATLAAGAAVPAGGLADISSTGVAVDGAVLYRFLPSFAVRAGLGADMLDGTADAFGNLFPSLSLLHVTIGIRADLPRPRWQSVPLTTSLDLGVGLTRMDADQQDVTGPVGQFTKTYPAATGGLRIGWQFGRHIEVFGQGRTYLTLGDRDELRVFSDHSPEVGDLRTLWSFPITLGVRVSM